MQRSLPQRPSGPSPAAVGGRERRVSRVGAVLVSAAAASSSSRLDPKTGKNVDGPDLSVVCPSGLVLPNPFVIGSGPPGTNHAVMRRAFLEGWGAVVAKTVSLDSTKIVNVSPRYSKIRSRGDGGGDLVGWENIELISDRPLEKMLDEFSRLKEEFPDRVLIASLMEDYDEARWDELVERVAATGVDALEINFSCPHIDVGRMGIGMGRDSALVAEVCSWVASRTTLPFWAKLTPNITDISALASSALLSDSGKKLASGVSAINTVNSISGVDLETLRPMPSVEGKTTPGGYSGRAVKPIALAKVASIAGMIKRDGGGRFDLSGVGGVETGEDAAEFILLGSDTVQVCTGVMVHGYGLASELAGGLSRFMAGKGFSRVSEFKGLALEHVTTHSELVRRQREAIAAKKAAAAAAAAGGRVTSDDQWSGEGDDFQRQSDALVAE